MYFRLAGIILHDSLNTMEEVLRRWLISFERELHTSCATVRQQRYGCGLL